MSQATRAARLGIGLCVLAAAATGCGSSTSGPAANATDRAFADQMIPHHQLVVQMAHDPATASRRAELRVFGARLVRTRERQLASMQAFARAAGVHPLSGVADGRTMQRGPMADDTRTLAIPARDMNMTMQITDLGSKKPFDRAFVDTMIPYHQCEIRMARAELAHGRNAAMRRVATEVLAAQPSELRTMNAWRRHWYGAPSPAGGVPA